MSLLGCGKGRGQGGVGGRMVAVKLNAKLLHLAAGPENWHNVLAAVFLEFL